MRKVRDRTDQMKRGLLKILGKRVGRAKATSVMRIAKALGCWQSEVDTLMLMLRLDGIAVCGSQASGYFMAASAEELQGELRVQRNNALMALTLEARLRHIPCVDVLAGLAANLEEREGYRIGVIKPASMFASS